jgi:hypothetical protein
MNFNNSFIRIIARITINIGILIIIYNLIRLFLLK